VQAHFLCALPHLSALLRRLAPELATAGHTPPPTAWLSVLPRVINTAITLLCSDGVANADSATISLCHTHRLLLALAQHYDLWGSAATAVQRFAVDVAARTKEGCPNLGWLLPLLGLAPKFSLRKLLPAVLSESRDRAILWLCREAPHAAAALQRSSPAKDTALVSAAWRAGRVSLRLLMFHSLFLSCVACPPGRRLDAVMHGYDLLYGLPSNRACDRMRAGVERILAVDDLAGAYEVLGLVYPGDTWLTAALRKAWATSLRKGYHTRRMDFFKVQGSGVSKILLKGSQYSAPPTLRRIVVTDHWRWACEHVVYLDASCVAVRATLAPDGSCAVQREVVDEVDFRNLRSSKTRMRGAMRHSGDIIDHREKAGRHTMHIDLSGVGLKVDELYFLGSAWGFALAQVQQPLITVADPDTGMELCSYSLDDIGRQARATDSAIVMCRVFRGHGRCHVQALGSTGPGDLTRRGCGALMDKLMRAAAAAPTDAAS
jgi:stress response protein SCP2